MWIFRLLYENADFVSIMFCGENTAGFASTPIRSRYLQSPVRKREQGQHIKTGLSSPPTSFLILNTMSPGISQQALILSLLLRCRLVIWGTWKALILSVTIALCAVLYELTARFSVKLCKTLLHWVVYYINNRAVTSMQLNGSSYQTTGHVKMACCSLFMIALTANQPVTFVGRP